MERDEALERLRSARVGRLATVRRDGSPHVVPFVFAVIAADETIRVCWAVDDKPKRSTRLARLRNLQANPVAEIVVDGYDEDWTRLWWVRASGRGRVIERPEEAAEILEALARKYPQYVLSPPTGPVVAIDVETITGWEARSRDAT